MEYAALVIIGIVLAVASIRFMFWFISGVFSAIGWIVIAMALWFFIGAFLFHDEMDRCNAYYSQETCKGILK